MQPATELMIRLISTFETFSCFYNFMALNHKQETYTEEEEKENVG